MSAETTAANLRALFAPFGEVVDVMVAVTRSTGQSRGFDFVSYRSSMDANQAIASTNGVELDGRPIRVNHAEARPGRS